MFGWETVRSTLPISSILLAASMSKFDNYLSSKSMPFWTEYPSDVVSISSILILLFLIPFCYGFIWIGAVSNKRSNVSFVFYLF